MALPLKGSDTKVYVKTESAEFDDKRQSCIVTVEEMKINTGLQESEVYAAKRHSFSRTTINLQAGDLHCTICQRVKTTDVYNTNSRIR